MVESGIYSKWLIEGFEGYCFGSDKELYKLPYTHKLRSYGLRKLKEQPPNRYKINGNWWSKRQLKDRIYLNPNPELIVSNCDMPF